MGSLWRSEVMQLIQLYIQKDAAHDTVDELGDLGIIQFRDLNPMVNSFQRNFVSEIRRCDENERKLRFFYDQVRREEQLTNEPMLQEFNMDAPEASSPGTVKPTGRRRFDLDELDVYFDSLEKELRQMNSSQESIEKNYNELLELLHVLKKDAKFFEQEVLKEPEAIEESKAPLMTEESPAQIGYLTGVISKAKLIPFERVLWRALHGNIYFKSAEIEEKLMDGMLSGEKVDKYVFIVFFHGEESYRKIRKISEAFTARLCPCPNKRKAREELLSQVQSRLDDMRVVVENSLVQRRRLIDHLSLNLLDWVAFVRREKSIYHVLNHFNFDNGRKCLIAEGWCPATRTDEVLEAINRATKRSGSTVPSIMSFISTKDEPPTSFPTTKFTAPFQAIVDAYGVARYREVNPGVFTIITFPFLFAIMFGDWGHAILMLCAALALIKWEKSLQKARLNEIVSMLFSGRYMLLLMAAFSIYTGLLYNEFFCLPVGFFKSHFECDTETGACEKIPTHNYPFGVDPMWRWSTNELYFYNSLKMKISIIFGVAQMTLGVILSLFNQLRLKKTIDVLCMFIPQLIFLSSVFGYLVFLIILKWYNTPNLPSQPFLINVLIGMFLSFGNLPDENKMYAGQQMIQTTLAVLAILSIFVMLVPKPLYLNWKHKQLLAHPELAEHEEHDPHDDHTDENGEFNLVDVFILQAIHTIEFALGCISHTASYLRLWALSLAHSELSIVFYEQLFFLTLKLGNFGAAFIGFACWGGVTIGILLMMEALSAFLHALRLHWVEFQSKFYAGDGYSFVPFSYTLIDEALKVEFPTGLDEE